MQTAQSLFEIVGVIRVPRIEKFVVAEHFKINMSEDAPVRIVHIGHTFYEDMRPKIERNIAAGQLKLSRLRADSRDGYEGIHKPGTFVALGGEDWAITSCYEFHRILADKQAKRKCARVVGYEFDIYDTLRPVFADWHGIGWVVDASAYNELPPWKIDCEFVSH